MDSYIQYGLGAHTCLGKEASKVALTAMLRVVGRLDNLRRAPGPQGQLKKVPRAGGFYVYMKEDYTSYFPFPMSESPVITIGKRANLTCFPCSFQGSLRWRASCAQASLFVNALIVRVFGGLDGIHVVIECWIV